jgi:hypothetical protein
MLPALEVLQGVMEQLMKERPKMKLYLKVYFKESVVKVWKSETNGLLEK